MYQYMKVLSFMSLFNPVRFMEAPTQIQIPLRSLHKLRIVFVSHEFDGFSHGNHFFAIQSYLQDLTCIIQHRWVKVFKRAGIPVAISRLVLDWEFFVFCKE